MPSTQRSIGSVVTKCQVATYTSVNSLNSFKAITQKQLSCVVATATAATGTATAAASYGSVHALHVTLCGILTGQPLSKACKYVTPSAWFRGCWHLAGFQEADQNAAMYIHGKPCIDVQHCCILLPP